MRVLIGTYRQRVHIETALRSLDDHVTGVSDLVFIDDSGDDAHATWLAQYGKVIQVGAGRRGYGTAMATLCTAAEGQECFVLEEDFTFLVPVDLAEMSDMLYQRPWLAQVVLLRGPVNPVEIQCGGVLEMIRHYGNTVTEVSGLLEHTAYFSCNPSVWRGHVFATGWPRRRWSEDGKRDELLAMGYRFAYLPGIRVEHHGERSGFDY